MLIRRLWHGLTVARFTWIVPDQLAACTLPKRESDWQRLRDAGIGLLINLHERPHRPDTLAVYGLQERHLPVPDFQPPQPKQLMAALTAIQATLTDGGKVAVHCRGGLGRTGTVLACYLVQSGLTAAEALARLRQSRPGSVETRQQELAVQTFAALLGR